jgi:peroxiredoxin
MAAHDQDDLTRWVDARLAAVDPPPDWSASETRGLARFRNRRRAGGGSRWRAGMWLAIAAGAIALTVIPTATLRGFAHACGELVRRGLPGSHSTDSYARAGGRRMLSDDQWRDLRGEIVRLSAYRGKVVLLTYWTTTCGQCASEMAWFNEFQQRYRELGLEVVGVSVDQGGVESAKAFVTSRPIDYQVVVGDRNAGLTVRSIPTTFILDRDGRVAARHVGYCSKRELESDIRAVLAESSVDGSQRLP